MPTDDGTEARKHPRATAAKRGRARHDAYDLPTPEEDMLYLIVELERSVRMCSASLSPTLAADIQRRLQGLAQTMHRLVPRHRP